MLIDDVNDHRAGRERRTAQPEPRRGDVWLVPAGARHVPERPTIASARRLRMTSTMDLRAYRSEQQRADWAAYWALRQAQRANGKKRRDAAAELAALDAAARAAGRSVDDVEKDTALLDALDAVGDIDERQRVADADIAKLKAASDEAAAKAADLRKQAAELETQVAADRRRYASIADRMHAARSERTRVVYQLAKRGHPPSVAALQRVTVESSLREARRELAGRREFLAGVLDTAKGRASHDTAHLRIEPARRDVAEAEARVRELEVQLQEVTRGA